MPTQASFITKLEPTLNTSRFYTAFNLGEKEPTKQTTESKNSLPAKCSSLQFQVLNLHDADSLAYTFGFFNLEGCCSTLNDAPFLIDQDTNSYLWVFNLESYCSTLNEALFLIDQNTNLYL